MIIQPPFQNYMCEWNYETDYLMGTVRGEGKNYERLFKMGCTLALNTLNSRFTHASTSTLFNGPNYLSVYLKKTKASIFIMVD